MVSYRMRVGMMSRNETSLSKTTTDIKNIKKYLLSALYNAPVTMENYYDAWVKHDMAAGNVGF